jgi:hypothetical protein
MIQLDEVAPTGRKIDEKEEREAFTAVSSKFKEEALGAELIRLCAGKGFYSYVTRGGETVLAAEVKDGAILEVIHFSGIVPYKWCALMQSQKDALFECVKRVRQHVAQEIDVRVEDLSMEKVTACPKTLDVLEVILRNISETGGTISVGLENGAPLRIQAV